MGYHFELEETQSTVYPVHGQEPAELEIDGTRRRVSLSSGSEPGEAILELDGKRERVWIATRGDVHFIHYRGRSHRVEAVNALIRAARDAAPSGGNEILRAPMPGVVVEITAEAGQEVESGELLMTIESMKLQTAISAPHGARVAEIYVSEGSSFEQGGALVRLEAEIEEESE